MIGVVYGIVLTLLKVLFKRTVTKIFAILILLCILAISYIAALVSAANMGPEDGKLIYKFYIEIIIYFFNLK